MIPIVASNERKAAGQLQRNFRRDTPSAQPYLKERRCHAVKPRRQDYFFRSRHISY